MLSYSVFGVHDWSARLIPALSVHGCILLTYCFGRRRVGESAAFWGALLLFLAPGFMGMARLLLLDGILAFLVTLALFSALEAVRGPRLRWRWWLLAATACGLGILAKGPIILILVAVPLWLHRRLTGADWHIGWRAMAIFWAITLGVALPWYAAICVRLPEFAYYFLWEHNVLRFFQPFDHIRPVWFYVPVVFLGLMPAALLAIPFVRFLMSGDPDTARNRTTELGFYLLSGLWCLFFFSMSGSKLPTYILPAFPPLALALGAFVAATKWKDSGWTRGFIAAAFAFVMVGNYFLVPWYAESRSPMNRPEQVRELCGDPEVPVVCYPRQIDSVSFYLGRDDLRCYRSKVTDELVTDLQNNPRTVVLFSHRHSLEQLRNALPPGLEMTHTGPLGLCSLAVVEQKRK
jgi:4-amino-4-deoxy-L-arabinose transferase-like glycosyltransferase